LTFLPLAKLNNGHFLNFRMKQRLIYLDNIKVFLIAYVITGHIAASYGAIGGGRWSYIEPGNDFLTKAVLSLFVLLAYSFLMGMFIFIAGYFTYPSLKSKGVTHFVKDRIIRLSIPLILYYFFLGPVARYITKLAKGEELTFMQFITDSYQSGVYGHLGVMWFIVLILIFSLAYALFYRFFPDGLYKPKNELFPLALRILFFVVIIGAASYLTRIIFPMGGDFVGSRPLGSMVFFGTSFFLGTAAARYQWLEKLTWQNSKPWIITAVVAMVIPVILLLIFKKNLHFRLIAQPGSPASLFYAYWEVIKTLGTGMAAIVLFRKWFNSPGKIANALGRSVLLSYFLHPLVCALFFLALAGTGLHPLLKFSIVAPGALVSTFALAWLLLQIPALRKIM
jgi:fucose 4-O-acetylase-like acetyltransferase